MSDQIPYQDEVKFYANPKLKRIIYRKIEDKGKGWSEVTVGKHKVVTRSSAQGVVRNLLNEKYPEYKPVNLFTSLSYHRPINKRITKYGSKKYMLQYSKYQKIGNYKLERPVKTNQKRIFGKVVKKVPLYNWDYSVINWFGDNENIELKRSVHSPFEDNPDKIIYSSGQVPKSRANQLIKQLRRMAK